MNGRREGAAEEYAAVRSIDTGSVARVAVGERRIALGTVSGGLALLAVDADESVQFEIESRPRGLAVDPALTAGFDERIRAFDFDGSSRWSADVAGTEALCSLPSDSLVVVATDAGEFVGLDADDGSERFRAAREHADVSDRVHLAGRDGRLLAGASWYLTVFDADGGLSTEADLDGAITALGALGDLAVAALRGGRLAGVDVETGETRWVREVTVDWLAPRGADGLFAADDDRLLRVSPDGEVTTVDVLPPSGGSGGGSGGRIVATTDGSLACRIDGSDVDVYRPTGSLPAVDLSIRESSARVGEDVTVDVESRGAPVRGKVRIRGDDASFRPASRVVRLDADDRTTVAFTLADAAAPTAATTVEFLAADSSSNAADATAAATLQIHSDPSTLAVEAECRAIEGGTATIEVTVATDDGSELPSLSVSPGDVHVDPSPGESSVRRSVSVPLAADRIVVTPTSGDHEPVERDLSLPADPLSVSIAGREGFVDVALSNGASVPIEDVLAVRIEGGPSAIERPVSLAPGAELTLAIPALRSGRIETEVTAAVVETTAVATIDTPALDGMRSASHSSRASDPSSTSDGPSRSPERSVGPASDPPVPAEERTSESRGSNGGRASESPAPLADSASAPSRERETAETAEDSPESESAPTRGEPSDEPGSEADDPIGLAREFDAETVPQGHAIEETVTVENRSAERRSVTLSSGDGSEATEETVPADGDTRLRRYHTTWDGSQVEIPGLTARTGEYESTLPATAIEVESMPVVVRPVLFERAAETGVRVAVRNDLDRPCSVVEIGSRGFPQSASFDDFEVAPGAVGRAETTYEGTPVEDPSLTFVGIEDRQRPIRTLAPVRERASTPVSLTLDSVVVLGEKDTNVVVRVENGGDVSVDVRVEASGEAPDEYLYSASTIEGLAPGDSETHRIECTTDTDDIELPVEVAVTPVGEGDASDGEPTELTALVSGDRAADADEWSIDTGDGEESVDATDPVTLSTPFERA